MKKTYLTPRTEALAFDLSASLLINASLLNGKDPKPDLGIDVIDDPWTDFWL